ncbi:MAG: 4-hydroxy-tetrahydrodipicolinate synthase [Alphaproteobacteria bacterium]|nr:4-hydroxy-tetrahydrodipicolinate synthase [Alphaproteobacteria bacterium]
MANRYDFGHVITAMVTPFKKDENLSVDFDNLVNLANHLIQNGTDTLLLTGSTGEDAQLSLEEKWAILKTVRQNTPSGTRLMVSTGDTNTGRAIRKAQTAFECGADGILVSVPEYIKPSQESLLIHFGAIAKSIDGPMMIYNIPSRTGTEILPETIMELAYRNSNIIGIKQSCSNLDRLSEMKENHLSTWCPYFQIYSGDDSLTLPMLALGAKGVVSVASHLQGNLIQLMIHEFKSGHVENALKIHQGLFPLFRALFMETNPLPIKEALYQKGMIATPSLRTLGEMIPHHKNKLNQLLKIFDRPKRESKTPTSDEDFLNQKTHRLYLLQRALGRSRKK